MTDDQRLLGQLTAEVRHLKEIAQSLTGEATTLRAQVSKLELCVNTIKTERKTERRIAGQIAALVATLVSILVALVHTFIGRGGG